VHRTVPLGVSAIRSTMPIQFSSEIPRTMYELPKKQGYT
jgi:hypothetical protein